MKKTMATPKITGLRREGPVRDVPGEGGVTRAPGPKMERSAAEFADAMSRRGGSAKDA